MHYKNNMPARQVFTGISHGTLGELFQGPHEESGELNIAIISLPLKSYSWVHFSVDPGAMQDDGIGSRSKTRKAIDLYLQHHSLTLPPGSWNFSSQLLQGKGMSSSTADIVAAIRCLDSHFALEPRIGLMTDILRQIERSDSVFLDHYALYLSGKQKVVEDYQYSPSLYACFIDEGEVVDTEKTHDKLIAHYDRNFEAYARVLTLVRRGFKSADASMICEGSTRSAILSQGILPKKNFDAVLEHQQALKADGIVVAHTGSVLGYLFINKPSAVDIGRVSAFFFGLGKQCSFVKVGLS